MFVHFANSEDRFAISQEMVENIVTATLDFKGVSCDEISVYSVTAEEIARLHEEYFNDPSPTDCITFPLDSLDDDSPYKVLGEIFVCPQIAFAYSQENKVDFGEELTLYILHGILHLLGFDDIEENDREIMRAEEFSCMEHLKNLQLIINPKLNNSSTHGL